MNFEKGQIITYTFPSRPIEKAEKSNVIEKYHRAVVLHKRETPFKTILIAPITKAASLKDKGIIPSNYVELNKADYPFALEEDSYINLDMTMPVDDVELVELGKGSYKISAKLEEFDLYQLDYKITLTYEINKFLNTELALKINEEFESVITFIDEEIKVKIEQVLQSINNPKILAEVIGLIDLLLSQIKENYIKPSVERGKYSK